MNMRNRLRVFNKYVTNRVLRWFADRGIGPFAIVGHVGRRSGKRYETVIWVWPTPTRDQFVIALTYGAEVDWRRNLLAAGGGTVFWHGKLYRVGTPEPIDAATALPAFPALFRLIFRTVGRQMQFVRLTCLDAAPITA
jgi:deazaflavin-dependent oxidoreductase (nitroreductase family)